MTKRTNGLMIMALALIGLFMASCSSEQAEYTTADSGLKYRFIESNDDQPMIGDGEIMSLKMTYGTADTTLFSSEIAPDQTMKLKMSPPAYPGDFYEMMTLVHLGDSVEFVLNAEEFFLKTTGSPTVPPFAVGITELIFNVRIANIQTEEQLQEEMMAEADKLKNSEADLLLEYIAENSIAVEPTESGLYLVLTEEGSGPKPVAGDNVKVHYTGTLLDGTVFDSSVERGQPIEFPIGQGRVIRGWDEGIGMLNVGSKATLVIPSAIGYGERGGAGGVIPPFATLVFDVELIDIVK